MTRAEFRIYNRQREEMTLASGSVSEQRPRSYSPVLKNYVDEISHEPGIDADVTVKKNGNEARVPKGATETIRISDTHDIIVAHTSGEIVDLT